MSNFDLTGGLDLLRQGFKSVATQTPLAQVQQNEMARDLTGQLQEIQRQGGDITQSPLTQQLAAVAPQQAQALLQGVVSTSSLGEERLFKDAATARQMVAQDPVSALKFLKQRANQIAVGGGDASDTNEVIAKLEAGDVAGATKDLSDVVNVGRVQGVLAKAPGSKVVEVTKAGQAVVQRPDGTVQVVDLEGFRQAPQDAKTNLEIAKLQASIADIGERREARQDARAAARKAAQREVLETAEQDLGQLALSTGTIDRILEQEDAIEDATGLSGVALRNLPGSAAADVTAEIESLKSQVFLTQVERLRGMGALSENEGKKLAQAAGALDVENMSAGKLKSELRRVKKDFEAAVKRARDKIRSGNLTPEQLRGLQSRQPTAGAAPQSVGRFQIEVVQ